MGKITNEELVKIYFAYYGSKVSHPCDGAPFYFKGVKTTTDNVEQPLPVLYGDWSGGTNPNLSCESYTNWEDCTLLLSALSSITDDECIEVAKIPSRLTNIDYEGAATSEIIDMLQYLFSTKYMGSTVDYEYQSDMISLVECGAIIPMTDYLRSRSYNVGYGKYSPNDLVETGMVRIIDNE